MVAKMKPASNEGNAEDRRSFRSRRVNYTINKKQQ